MDATAPPATMPPATAARGTTGATAAAGAPAAGAVGQPLRVLGHQVTLLDSPAEYVMLEALCMPDVPGPPPHHHPFSEFFYIAEGELDLMADGAWQRLAQGQSVTLAPGVVHTFRNPGSGADALRHRLRAARLRALLRHVRRPGRPARRAGGVRGARRDRAGAPRGRGLRHVHRRALTTAPAPRRRRPARGAVDPPLPRVRTPPCVTRVLPAPFPRSSCLPCRTPPRSPRPSRRSCCWPPARPTRPPPPALAGRPLPPSPARGPTSGRPPRPACIGSTVRRRRSATEWPAPTSS
jgi:quercetin dioxygenase-like cupin family protein